MERKGDWFQTFSGKRFYPFDPRPEDIHIKDIAHSLSLLCRFQGHVRDFYSVGQHSILVCGVFKKLIAGTTLRDNSKAYLCALLHDATEAYCGDCIRPIKKSMTHYQNMETVIWDCVLLHFGLEDLWYQKTGVQENVKRADEIMLATERRDLLPNYKGMEWYLDGQVEPDPAQVRWMAPVLVERMFLDLFNKLVKSTV